MSPKYCSFNISPGINVPQRVVSLPSAENNISQHDQLNREKTAETHHKPTFVLWPRLLRHGPGPLKSLFGTPALRIILKIANNNPLAAPTALHCQKAIWVKKRPELGKPRDTAMVPHQPEFPKSRQRWLQKTTFDANTNSCFCSSCIDLCKPKTNGRGECKLCLKLKKICKQC